MSDEIKNIAFSKRYYGKNVALEALDEEFEEFLINPLNWEEFFKMYNDNFYKISKSIHQFFIKYSRQAAFPNGYQNKIVTEWQNLTDSLKEIRKEYDSVEREHFFFKNGNFILSDDYQDLPGGFVDLDYQIYYMQSGKKRLIAGDNQVQTYKNIKEKKYKNQNAASIPDQDIIIFLPKNLINEINTGPDIVDLSSLSISNLEINIYPTTIAEYEANGNQADITDYLTSIPIRD